MTFDTETIFLIVGFVGQVMFTGRFVVQWLHSERKKESVIPTLFWHFSIGGSSLLLVYAIYRHDPVFILGQSLGLFIYFRNLQFIYRKKKEDA